jgi:peptidoglycan hydrolase CwlO-like protein
MMITSKAKLNSSMTYLVNLLGEKQAIIDNLEKRVKDSDNEISYLVDLVCSQTDKINTLQAKETKALKEIEFMTT